jgi:putative ABC transport system permease protein
VTGILAPTGTPVDRTVHFSLEAMTAIHLGWESGAPRVHVSAEQARQFDLTPHEITAFMVGLKSKIQTFRLQRAVDEYPEEPLLAIIPGVALSELWSLVGVAENALRMVSAFVVAAGLIGMLAVILASLNERRREMAILRAMGARPGHVFLLLLAESAAFGVAGCVLGVALLNLGVVLARPFVATRWGLYLEIAPPSLHDWFVLSLVMAVTLVVGAVPAYRAYRYSLADGMTVRI